MPTRLQSTSGKANADTSFDLAYTGALTAGSHLVVFAVCFDEGGDGGLGVSSSGGHTFSPIFAEQGLSSQVYVRAWIAPNAGTSTPTITFTGGDYWFCVLTEYSGVDATTQIDATAVAATGSGTTSPNAVQSGNYTPVTDGCKLVAFFGVRYEAPNDLTSITEPSGFDVVATSLTWQTDGGAGGVADDDQVTATTVNPSWSVAKPNGTVMQWAAATFALRPAAGGGITGTAAPTLDSFTPTASGTVEQLPFPVASAGAALSTNDPSVTFTGYTPLENDLVILFPSSTTVLGVVANASLPAGWANPLGDGVEINSDAHGMAALYHLVTAAEETAVTTTYTATDALDAAETGYVHGEVFRYVNPAAPIDGFNTDQGSGNTTTPHVLAGITGSGVLLDDSMVVSSVAKDATGAYSSVPAGWTQLQATNTNQGRWTGIRNTLTTVDTDVTATNITPSAGDEYVSITLALAKVPNTDRTGTVAVTLADFTSAASGTVANAVTGTVAVTLDPFTSSATGTVTSPGITGTVAVTLDVFTAAASGTVAAPGVTGTVAVTLAAFTTTTTAVVVNGTWPVAVSGDARYLIDQHSDPWFGVGDTAWSLSAQLTTAEITTYLEDRAAKGVNLVLFSAPEKHFTNQTPLYRNVGGDDPFTGTAFQSALNGAYWAVIDHAAGEAARLGVTLMICPAYLGFPGTDEGWNDEVVAATNADMTGYGEALAARYAIYPNMVWLIGHDRTPDATEQARQAALADALQANTTHLVTVGIGPGSLGSDGWEGSGVDYDFDTAYDNNDAAEAAAKTAAGWAASPTMPVGFLEGRYEAEGGFANQYNDEPFIRSQLYGPLCAGATYALFGNNPMWHFEASNTLYAYTGTWETNLDSPGSVKLAVFAGLVGDLGANWASMVPDTTDTFLTVGEGTGATRAAARFDGTTTTGVLAVCYRPDGGSASLTFDLTELNQVANVRVRKFDPFDGTYATIGTFATTGTQAVGSLGTNGAGDGDWLLVFDPSTDITGTATPTLGSFTSSASGTSTPPAFTGTVAVTLAVFEPAASGTSTPPAFTGTVAVTLAVFTSSAAGTSAPPPVTGTAAIELAAFTADALGAFTPTGSGSAAVTLDPFTSDASGTFTPAETTGSAAVTLDAFVSAATGTTVPPAITGTAAVTLDPFTPDATGTITGPGVVTGTVAATLDAFTADAAGSHTPPAITGTAAIVLGLFVAAAFSPPSGTPSVRRTWRVQADDRTLVVAHDRIITVPADTRAPIGDTL